MPRPSITLPAAHAFAGVLLLATFSGTAPAVGGETTVLNPLQPAVRHFGGRSLMTYFVTAGEVCATTLVLDDRPAGTSGVSPARTLTIELASGQTATVGDGRGEQMRLRCAVDAMRLEIEPTVAAGGQTAAGGPDRSRLVVLSASRRTPKWPRGLESR